MTESSIQRRLRIKKENRELFNKNPALVIAAALLIFLGLIDIAREIFGFEYNTLFSKIIITILTIAIFISAILVIKLYYIVCRYVLNSKILSYIVNTLLLIALIWIANARAAFIIEENLLLSSDLVPTSKQVLSFLTFIRYFLLILAYLGFFTPILLPVWYIIPDICRNSKSKFLFTFFGVDKKKIHYFMKKLRNISCPKEKQRNFIRYMLAAIVLLFVFGPLNKQLNIYMLSHVHDIIIRFSFIENLGQCRNVVDAQYIHFISEDKIVVAAIGNINAKQIRYYYYIGECVKVNPSILKI